MNQKDAIRRSALWAAYGDALGFITELADARTLRSRTDQAKVKSLSTWRRRIGGRFGVDQQLPQGCYSDDTQLRLSTCRSIRADGCLDAEVFAKIELPVWRAYALGAGRGTKVASQALTRSDVSWWGNFFSSGNTQYMNAGGNGAAMRIQPHAWAAPLDQKDSFIVREIIRNSVITHGHFRGILGAAFHGLCLRETLKSGMIPTAKMWQGILENLQHTGKVICLDNDLRTLWVPKWQQESRCSIDDSINRTIGEMREDIDALVRMPKSDDIVTTYNRALQTVDALSPQQRGSGTKTAILSAFLASECRDVQMAIEVAANALGSDTDSIGTMVGAILGATAECEPPESVMDAEYIVKEAEKMFDISQAAIVQPFVYPDLLYWEPPKVEADVVSFMNGEWHVAGLGEATPIGLECQQNGKNPTTWQWFRLRFGQTVLLKRRASQDESNRSRGRKEPALFDRDQFGGMLGSAGSPVAPRRAAKHLSVEEALAAALKSSFDPRVVGAMLLDLSSGEGGIERAIEYARGVVAALDKGKRG